MTAVDVALGDTFSAGVPRELFTTAATRGRAPFYDVRADGQQFLIPGVGNEDVPISVVLNWWVELE
jgi:hypothetical protein